MSNHNLCCDHCNAEKDDHPRSTFTVYCDSCADEACTDAHRETADDLVRETSRANAAEVLSGELADTLRGLLDYCDGTDPTVAADVIRETITAALEKAGLA